MADTGFRLREQLPSLEADEVSCQIGVEDNEVFEIKKEMVQKMRGVVGTGRERNLFVSSNLSKEAETERPNKDIDRLRGEMTRIRERLENQGSLIDDLVQTKDKEMVRRELLTLDRVFDDFVATMAQLRKVVDTEEAEELSQLIAEEDASVFRRKKLVTNFLVENKEERRVSVKFAEVGSNSCNGYQPRKESIHRGTLSNEDSEKVKEAERCSEESVVNLTRLNELMVQTMKLQAAPKVEIDVFSGDPLEFTYFIENFKDVVESLVSNPKQRLVRLLKYTTGEAKDLIKHCVHEESNTCYTSALQLLEKEYGSPFRITCAYLEKLKTWPQIKRCCCNEKLVPVPPAMPVISKKG